MKKALYMILLLVEFVAGFGLLALGTTVTGWTYFLIITAVWAALMVLLLAKRKKAADENGKRNLALAMLLPALAAVIGFAWVVSTVSR